jgi:peptidyl-prolyl cis-trans isomerase SurA
MLIDRKLLLSRAKEKKYDVEQYLEMVIKEIMKKNNFNTKDDLRNALIASGIDYEEWKKYQRNELIIQSLIQNEIGSKIMVENSQIMEYYRKNADKYTKPAEFSLNCIFLDKKNYLSEQALEDKKTEVAAKLAENKNFEETAKEYSEMAGAENNFFLGDYKKGELDAAIEEAAMKLKDGEFSGWIAAANGWYMIRMIKFTPPQMIEYKTIRDEIEQTIKEDKLNEEIKKYVKKLREDSHIKIYEEYR